MEIKFNYLGEDISYQCNDTKETVNTIFQKIKSDVDLNSVIFLYSANQIEGNISLSKIINKNDLQRNKMNIIVMEKENEPDSVMIQSKDIICPKCGESAKFDITEYKIFLQCKNKHNLGNIFLNDFEKTQRIDISKIICDECKKTNKANLYKNIFYICNQCQKKFCIKCKDKHAKENREHIFINYDDKNYICNIHNEKYASYCKDCKKNICLYYNNEHSEHEIINYVNMLPNINEVKIKNEKLKNDIDTIKGIIDDLINRLSIIKDKIEYYYNINENIYNSLKNKFINYELLYTYNNLNKSNILNDINDIINNENIRFERLYDISNKINNKFNEEITIQYLIKKVIMKYNYLEKNLLRIIKIIVK